MNDVVQYFVSVCVWAECITHEWIMQFIPNMYWQYLYTTRALISPTPGFQKSWVRPQNTKTGLKSKKLAENIDA